MAALQDGSSCKGKIFILTVLLAWTTNQVLANGLRARPFPPVPWIVEIECSGRTLDADVDVLSMSLYDKDANEVLATLNLKTGDCTTTRRFSSCTRSQRGSHDSRISILFADIAGDATKSVGCDVTTLRSGERPSITSWFLSVTPPLGNVELHPVVSSP